MIESKATNSFYQGLKFKVSKAHSDSIFWKACMGKNGFSYTVAYTQTKSEKQFSPSVSFLDDEFRTGYTPSRVCVCVNSGVYPYGGQTS